MRKVLSLAIFLCFLLLAIFNITHPASAASITYTATPKQFAPGTTVNITGSGFPPNHFVKLVIDGIGGTPCSGCTQEHIYTKPDGSLPFTVFSAWPATNQPTSTFSIRFIDERDNKTLGTPIQIEMTVANTQINNPAAGSLKMGQDCTTNPGGCPEGKNQCLPDLSSLKGGYVCGGRTQQGDATCYVPKQDFSDIGACRQGEEPDWAYYCNVASSQGVTCRDSNKQFLCMNGTKSQDHIKCETLKPVPPCAVADIDQETGACKKISTGIGNIPVDPAQFIQALFGIILSISGGIALLLIIFSGYRLMTAQGNPEAIQGAKETLTSAIIGLLFIIFSITIMQIIGVDILHIPGLGK